MDGELSFFSTTMRMSKCTFVLDLGSQTTKDIARILIRNRKDWLPLEHRSS